MERASPQAPSASPQVLCDAIRSEAGAECQRILDAARKQAERLLSETRAQTERLLQERLASARAEAARTRERIRSTIPLETNRLLLDRVEALLSALKQAIQDRLRTHEGFDFPRAVVSLAAEAISGMAGQDFVLKVSAADDLPTNLAEQVAGRLDRPTLHLVVSPSEAEGWGGVVVEDVTGRQVWDNRLEPRLERLWPELRRQIAAQAQLMQAGTSSEEQ